MAYATIQLQLRGPFDRERIRKLKKRMGMLMLKQTFDRIDRGGDDEIQFEPLAHDRPGGGSDHPLRGPEFIDSLSYGFDERGVWVGSNHIGARVLFHGTVGAGGTLPTIVPVQADALFIPLTRRAKLSTLQFGTKMEERRRVHIYKRKGRRVAGGLVQGKDFIFRKTSDVKPREYLRLSRQNRDRLRELFASPL